MAPVERVAPAGGGEALIAPERLARILPARPTRREKEVGRELALRAAVQAGHQQLQQAAAVAIAGMHDHTHRVIAAEVLAMNHRVRSIADAEDREELAAITAEQKAMFLRHQFGVLEAGCYRVAAEVDRPLYVAAPRGWRALLLGD